jgi:RNA polymerase sigma-70 factor (ECF subfamily)
MSAVKPDAEAFRSAIRRIRAGDERAAAELVQEYAPIIRREVRLKIEDARLRRAFDSSDVVQSVLASFFIRTAAGEYDLDSPAQLAGLLVRMTRNKVASASRQQYRHRRDARRTQADDDELQHAVAHDPALLEELANEEILARLRERLTSEERAIAELRADDRSWEEVAAMMGGKPQARRMQLTRGVERAARELGLAQLYE